MEPNHYPNPAARRIAEFMFECDDYPGGSLASYGAGTAFTEWDECFLGSGRSQADAASDALEQLAMSIDLDPADLERIEARDTGFSTMETECEEVEADCFEQYLAEEYDWTMAEFDAIEEPYDKEVIRQRFYDGLETVEIVAVLYIKFAD